MQFRWRPLTSFQLQQLNANVHIKKLQQKLGGDPGLVLSGVHFFQDAALLSVSHVSFFLQLWSLIFSHYFAHVLIVGQTAGLT